MTPRKKANSERINVFFSPEILERLKRIADRKGISVSGLVRMIVLDKLNKGIEILKNEIEQTKQIVDGLPEYEQQANKLFLDGLSQALSFIES